MYDAATAQYAYQTLKLLRREYNLASPHEQEAINSLIKQGAQIVFNSDLPEVYVAIFWQRIDLDKRGLGDWGYATREIFIEDDHVSTRGFAGACHFNGPIAYETFYPLNPTDKQLAEAREEIKFRLSSAYAILVESGAYEDAMNGLDWAEKARYENAVAEIIDLLRVMPLNEGASATK